MCDCHETINVYPTGFMLLKPVVHHYPWGIIGENSLVYKLFSQFIEDSTSNLSNEHYAELWLGTHIRGPSTVVSPDGNEPLSAHLKRLQLASPRGNNDSEYLGFLLKVLAIDSPLSVQVHPDAFMSSQLLNSGHLSIADATAKSEFTIALTDFELLYSLKSLEEIISTSKIVPEFGDLIGASGCGFILTTTDFSDKSENYKLTLMILQSVLCLDTSTLEILARLTSRLEHSASMGFNLNDHEKLLLRLHKSFPNDIGIWFGLVMNYVKLSPGQGLFTPPNTLHSYLSGTCIECMASSDNVIRAGLTKKYTDCPTALQCINRTINEPNITLMEPIKLDPNGYLVNYKVEHDSCNFSITRICLPLGASIEYTAGSDKCAIAITVASNSNVKISTLPKITDTPSDEICITTLEPNIGSALLIYPDTTIKIANGNPTDTCNINMEKPDIFIPPVANDWFVMFIAHSSQ